MRVQSFSNLSITNLTKGKLPSLPFLFMKEWVLGKEYELSVVIIDSVKSRELNRRYRKKDKPANVLSFALSKTSGEMFLDLKEIFKSKNSFKEKSSSLVGLYFIHGLVHLKGHQHGSTMDSIEDRIRKKFLN